MYANSSRDLLKAKELTILIKAFYNLLIPFVYSSALSCFFFQVIQAFINWSWKSRPAKQNYF